MVAHLGDGPNEMLSVLFDHTPALCFWAKLTWRLRAIKSRLRATVNIPLGSSPSCATIPRKIKKVLKEMVFSKSFLS